MMHKAPRYNIGQQYLARGTHPVLCTVIDIHTTYNAQGEHVQTRYVATHEFLGQSIRERDIPEATIARGIDELNRKKEHSMKPRSYEKQEAARTRFYGQLSEAEQARRGLEIARILRLKPIRERHDLFDTTHGMKTALGLYLTMHKFMEGDC